MLKTSFQKTVTEKDGLFFCVFCAFSWEQRKVSELFRVTRGYVLAATQTETAKTAEKPYPVYSSQTKDKGLMGYYKDYLYEDAITWTTDGANAGTVNYRAGKFYCTNVCGVLLSNEVKANQMIAEALNNVAKGYVSYVGNPKLMNNVMADIVIQIPTQAEEREQLSSFFTNLDHLITLHQRQHFLHSTPDISLSVRLIHPFYTSSWEQRKLGDVVKEITRNDPGSEAPIMMITANNGFIEQSERYAFNNAGESLKKYILLKKGELAYNHGASKLRPYGSCFALTTAENARIPFVYHCFSAENQNAEFMSIELNGAEIENQLRKIVSSGARMDGLLNISFDEYTSVSVILPGTEEQDRIADFFRHLDNLITLHQRKFEKLTNVKKSMLEKMFPQNGSSYPEIRFKGFTDPWEQRKLGEIGSVSMCRRIFKEQTSETGDIPFYKIGTFGADPDAFISRELFEEYKSKYPYPQKGDILISASGSIGRTVEFAGNNEYFQDSNIVWLNHDERLSNPFLKCFYSVVKWAGIEGSTIKRLYNDNILNTVICMPSVPEQKRIGLFCENLDNLITLHQRELEKLQNIKKSMLEKMFV